MALGTMHSKTLTKWKIIAAISLVIAVAFMCIAIIAVTLRWKNSAAQVEQVLTSTTRVITDSASSTTTPAADNQIKWPPAPDNQSQYRYAAVASPQPECSAIGTRILAEGGSAVDAAISVSLCLGVYKSVSCGIGGGSFITVYSKAANKTSIFNAREVAPLATNATLYADTNLKPNIGGGSIAVPGEVAGLWQAHQRFGKLSWSRLFQPSIKAAEDGVTINGYLASLFDYKDSYNQMNEPLRGIFTHADTGRRKKAGDKTKFPKLAETYRRIARDGKETFYNGSLKDDIMADLKDFGDSIITEEDLSNYTVEITEPVKSFLSNGEFTVVSPPPPSGGLVLQYILNILDGYNFTKDSISADESRVSSTATTYHRMVEAMKFAYAKRSNLGDSSFTDVSQYIRNMTASDFAGQVRSKITDNQTHNTSYYGLEVDPRLTTGTCHLSVRAGNGDAVSMTTSINYSWGSKRMGSRTGIIFNNQMDDFARPGDEGWSIDDAWLAPSSRSNWIEPGKRPLSAMSPTIVLDKEGNVRLVTGGSGGSRIISAVATTIMNNIWFEMPLIQAVSRPRLHHQLLPSRIFYETGFPQKYVDELKAKGHDVKVNTLPPATDSCSFDGKLVYGSGDPRRDGGQDGF